MCVCVSVCNVLREMLDVNVKVEVPTQYKFLKMNINRGFFLNASFPRNGNVSIYSYYRAASHIVVLPTDWNDLERFDSNFRTASVVCYRVFCKFIFCFTCTSIGVV